MSSYEGRKRRAFDHTTTTNHPEREKEHDREKKEKEENKKQTFLREGYISVFLSLLLNGDSSSIFFSFYCYRYR